MGKAAPQSDDDGDPVEERESKETVETESYFEKRN